MGFAVKRSVASIISLVVSVLLLSSCSHRPVPQPEQRTEDLVPIKSITVLPVRIDIDEKAPPDPVKKAHLEEGKKVMDQLLAEYFETQPSVKFLSESELKGLDVDLSLCTTFIERTRAICVNVGSDAAMEVKLYRYIPRQGTKYGADQPASVSFDYKLVQVKTGKILCRGQFDETQKPLLDDILSIFSKTKKRGIKWLTAPELAKEGIETKFNDCPYLKQ